ncbi:hypothetical protein PHMEG_00038707 [Phytophthora megakarya]|uniref:Uncharacterized protein n=1 Tax=Phytophthora megakarya TaxID=4795 RepID=A0A225UHA8_9STRA|nr:hypothetical protein PHMEG_00038707 [Phytophthora megakarya]
MNECSAPLSTPAPSSEQQAPDRARSEDEADPDLTMLDIEEEIAARDGGEVFPTFTIDPDSAPVW